MIVDIKDREIFEGVDIFVFYEERNVVINKIRVF